MFWSHSRICFCFTAATRQLSLQEVSFSCSRAEWVVLQGVKQSKDSYWHEHSAYLFIYLFFFPLFIFLLCISGHQSGFCMICVMQNHIIQAFANTGNAIKPVSFIRDLKSKYSRMQGWLSAPVMWVKCMYFNHNFCSQWRLWADLMLVFRFLCDSVDSLFSLFSDG